MVNIISTAAELGYLDIPKNTLIEIDKLKNYPPEKTVLITTGSQGESMAALSRMAADIHKKVTIMPGDTVIFSSNRFRAMKSLYPRSSMSFLPKGRMSFSRMPMYPDMPAKRN